MTTQDYEKQVFVNCPFDDEYVPMLDAIIFAIYDCGFRPRSAKENDDSGQIRIEKIMDLIKECQFGIHDISRTELDSANNLPRFNMPYELGIFIGAAKFGSPKQKLKRLMIIDKDKYRYQKFISDIAGQDIKSHDNDPLKIISAIRNWLSSTSGATAIPGGAIIKRRYTEYCANLPALCRQAGIELEELTYNDKADFITSWLQTNPRDFLAA